MAHSTPRTRFFIANPRWSGETIYIIDEHVVHQLTRVLRVKIGEQIVILDNTGQEF